MKSVDSDSEYQLPEQPCCSESGLDEPAQQLATAHRLIPLSRLLADRIGPEPDRRLPAREPREQEMSIEVIQEPEIQHAGCHVGSGPIDAKAKLATRKESNEEDAPTNPKVSIASKCAVFDDISGSDTEVTTLFPQRYVLKKGLSKGLCDVVAD